MVALTLNGCRKEESVEPTIPPLGKSFLSVEVNGKKQMYVEGEDNMTLFSSFQFSTEHPNPGHGASFENADGTINWGFFFFFTPEEYKQNTGNYPLLFKSGKHDFVKLDKSYQYLKIRGVEIRKTEKTALGTPWKSTAYQQNEQPQEFEVTDAYFYNLTYDRFIWVEGKFDCWIGDFVEAEHIKGTFRIKVQHDLQ